MKHLLSAIALLLCLVAAPLRAQEPAESPEQQAFMNALAALEWVKGPSTVPLDGDSTLVVPEGYVFLDAANTDKVPDYLLMDMSASYDLAALSASLKGVGVSLSASNLLNKTYYSCYDQNNCWFGAERSVEARLKYAF